MHPYPGQPTRMPYVAPDGAPGEMLNQQDVIARSLHKLGQVNPLYESKWHMRHGRQLAGLPGIDDSGTVDKQADFVSELEGEDDVYGSGIFDPIGRAPTLHRNLGVFEDSASLPGYVGRERQYAVSQEVVDITNGADVVVVAGGGMTYREVGGRNAGYEQFGPTPPAPAFRLPAPTGRDQPYAQLVPGAGELMQRIARVETTQRRQDGNTLAARHALQRGDSRGAAALVARAEMVLRQPVVAEVPPDRATRPVPFATPGAAIARRDISRATTPGVPITKMLATTLPISGYGADPSASAPGWGTYALVGLAVGAAAAMLVGATKIKTGR
jgi:hypothetical protein